MLLRVIEPILLNSNSYSFMRQTPFKIYRAEFQSSGESITAHYFYDKVNRKYRYNPKERTRSPLSKFFEKDMPECGIVSTTIQDNYYGMGIWVIKRFILDNTDSSNISRYWTLKFRDNKIYLNKYMNSDNEMILKSLNLDVHIINRTTIIGAADLTIESNGLKFSRINHRYSKAKKVMKYILMNQANEDPGVFSNIIEEALIEGYKGVSDKIKRISENPWRTCRWKNRD